MKQITLNIPDDYADALSITCIGGIKKGLTTNVYTMAYNISEVMDKVEIDVKAGGVNDD